MNNSGCHGNQSKKPLKIFSSQTANWIAFFFFFFLQECSSDTGLQNSLKKKRSVKKHGFYGRLIFLLWYKVKSLKIFFSKTIYWISLFFLQVSSYGGCLLLYVNELIDHLKIKHVSPWCQPGL